MKRNDRRMGPGYPPNERGHRNNDKGFPPHRSQGRSDNRMHMQGEPQYQRFDNRRDYRRRSPMNKQSTRSYRDNYSSHNKVRDRNWNNGSRTNERDDSSSTNNPLLAALSDSRELVDSLASGGHQSKDALYTIVASAVNAAYIAGTLKRNGPDIPSTSQTRSYSGNRRQNTRESPINRDRSRREKHEVDSPTRTLFIGNLEKDIDTRNLREIFEQFGVVEDIDIKRPQTGNAYAFIRYVNLDMSSRAKSAINGHIIGKFPCKIGYGKVNPTRCIWIGGLGTFISYRNLTNIIEKFGHPDKIVWSTGRNYAHALFNNIELAQKVAASLRDYPLGRDRYLRIDYSDENAVFPMIDRNKRQHYDARSDIDSRRRVYRRNNYAQNDYPFYKEYSTRKRNNSRSPVSKRYGASHYRNRSRSRSYGKRDDRSSSADNMHSGDVHNAKRPRTPSSINEHSPVSDPYISEDENELSCDNTLVMKDLSNCFSKVWQGEFFMKRCLFKCSLRIVAGDVDLVDTLLPMDESKSCEVISTSGEPKTPPEEGEEDYYDDVIETTQSGSDKPSTKCSGRPSTPPDDPPMSDQDDNIKDRAIFSELDSLRITQRMKLDENKLDDVRDRLKAESFCLLLAFPQTPDPQIESKFLERPLTDLVTYLCNKNAAGVVVLPERKGTSGILYAFPPGNFSHRLLEKHCPSKFPKDCTVKDTDHLIILIFKNNCSQASVCS